MTKEEAIKKLEEGFRLTHYYFSNYEWMILYNNHSYQFEDDTIIDINRFWKLRQNGGWNINWEIYKMYNNEI